MGEGGSAFGPDETFTTPPGGSSVAIPTIPNPPTTTTTVTTTPTASVTVPEAIAFLDKVVLRETGRAAHGMKDKCVSLTQGGLKCEVVWASARRIVSKTWIFAGDFTLQPKGEAFVFSFSGLRAHAGCLRRTHSRRCASSVKW
jgi:hypothetical protein